MKRTRLKRNGHPMKKVGKRTNDWRKVWRFLKPQLELRDRMRCEFDFIPHECCGNLTPAHSRKRRLMQGEEIYDVAIACINVHRILDEQFTHSQMFDAVMWAIEGHGGVIRPRDRVEEK